MKLQDKLQEILHQTARNHGHNDWEDVLIDFHSGEVNIFYVIQLQSEAMIAFAKYCCERQRMSDYKITNNIDVLNNPLITDELCEKK